MPLDAHDSAKPSGFLSEYNSQSNFSQVDLISDLAAESERPY